MRTDTPPTRRHDRAHLRQLSGDPTHTEAIRERFRRDVRSRFREVRGAVRAAVGYERDLFDLQESRLADADDVQRFETDESQTRAFIRWLTDALRDDVLEQTRRRRVRDGQHWTAAYVRGGYRRGWEFATDQLQQAGVEIAADAEPLRLGVPRRQLRKLYTRTYETLESVTADTAPRVRETLTAGLAEGVNPRELARRLTSEIATLQRTRAEVLARTEVINSHSEATLDRYERAGVDAVSHGEWATADDDRVCPICESLEGQEFTIDEMREGTFTFAPSESEPDHLAGEYRLKPPAHPQGRCAILPVIG
jgi:SPP1 gp7 family putative phage head morphogenesis protein